MPQREREVVVGRSGTMLTEEDRNILCTAKPVIDLSNRGLTDTDCLEIVEILCTRLSGPERGDIVELNLSRNAIGDVGIRLLSELFPHLLTIDLEHNPFTEKGYRWILEYRKNLSYMDWLFESHCRIYAYTETVPMMKRFWPVWKRDEPLMEKKME